MRDQPKPTSDLSDLDRRDQAAVLDHVLALYPALLTLAEVIQELTGGSADFPEQDRVQRAVRDLEGFGLLRTTCGLVMPTRAAIAFDSLRAEA